MITNAPWTNALSRIAPRVHYVWQGDWHPHSIEPPRRLYDHELVLVRRGACTITVDGRVHECCAPAFLIVPPTLVHSTRVIGGTPVRRLCVHFDWADQGEDGEPPWWSVVPRPFDAARARPAPPWIPPTLAWGPAPAHVEALADAVLARWHDGGAGRLRARAALLDLLIVLLAPEDPRPEAGRRGRELAVAVKDLLDRTAHDPRPIRTRLRGLGYSYEHLERCFRRHVGCTPRAYLAAARIEAARTLLDAGATVAATAERLGYSSPSHLIRAYKACTGTTPGRRRRARDLLPTNILTPGATSRESEIGGSRGAGA